VTRLLIVSAPGLLAAVLTAYLMGRSRLARIWADRDAAEAARAKEGN
jgi:hypothetical protein